MLFPDLGTAEGLKVLDDHLLNKSFLEGYEPTQADVKVFRAVKEADLSAYTNARRWFTNIKSFGGDELKAFPAGEMPVELVVKQKPAEVVSCALPQ